jgi:hypothetical protein
MSSAWSRPRTPEDTVDEYPRPRRGEYDISKFKAKAFPTKISDKAT